MKRLAVLVCLLVAIPLLADESPLKGAKTIFINGATFRQQRDITLAFKHELPQVRVVSHARGADVIADFTGGSDGTPLRTVTTGAAAATNGSASTSSEIGGTDTGMRAPSETTTYNPGHVVATLHRLGEPAIVIHEGLPSDFFANQFAARFIAAWRAANP